MHMQASCSLQGHVTVVVFWGSMHFTYLNVLAPSLTVNCLITRPFAHDNIMPVEVSEQDTLLSQRVPNSLLPLWHDTGTCCGAAMAGIDVKQITNKKAKSMLVERMSDLRVKEFSLL